MPDIRWRHIGNVLHLLRQDGPLTRADVIDGTGLSRSTVNQHLAALAEAGLIRESTPAESTGGRPSSRYAFQPRRAAVLTVDVGATGVELAVCDLDGAILSRSAIRIDVWRGPDAVLSVIWDAALPLLEAPHPELWAVSIGVPGPVEVAARRVMQPPIMTGWDGFDIVGWFEARLPGLPCIVENDVNARAIAEARLRGLDNLIALKLGTGLGAGLFFNGAIVRGARGNAGDIGHTRAADADAAGVICRCGNEGCVEALAGGWALQRDLRARGREAVSSHDVVGLVQAGDREALRLVRAAGRRIGDAVADLVGILNPSVVVLSGQLADCGPVLLSGITEKVHAQNGPISTGELSIEVSELGDLAGVTGLAYSAVDHLLSPAGLPAVLSRTTYAAV
ncbi:ROK family transcriptional regulator [Demequina pelophila]|uniref:ROK family transcriptional regulator n=1 Tax=Demequina pelophila TaxID=1638984 RepID=UPI001D0E3568|nr:ROK family transcriptional regulator [Demequina pelophila]